MSKFLKGPHFCRTHFENKEKLKGDGWSDGGWELTLFSPENKLRIASCFWTAWITRVFSVSHTRFVFICVFWIFISRSEERDSNSFNLSLIFRFYFLNSCFLIRWLCFTIAVTKFCWFNWVRAWRLGFWVGRWERLGKVEERKWMRTLNCVVWLKSDSNCTRLSD